MKRQKPIVLIIIVVALIASLLVRLRNFRERPDRQSRQEERRDRNENAGSTRQEQKNRDGFEPEKDYTQDQHPRSGNQNAGAGNEPEFNRNLQKIVYTKHARCRMGCRKIDESEILEIRDDGKVNFEKSELNSRPDPKFAVEGVTHDKQFVRVVFAQTSNSLVVVTCIDLDTDWSCSCN